MIRHTHWFILALAGAALASTTTTWEMNTYQDFLRGQFSNISLSRDGRLSLAPKLEAVFASDQPEIWSIAKAPDGGFYLGTGHRGRVYKVDASGHGTLVWTSEQPEVFAVAVDPHGVLYAATSPDGRIYRIENGTAHEFFAPGQRYIWTLAFAPDGRLYVGTGDKGKIYVVGSDGKGSVYFESGQANITSLAIDSEGRLLAGSDPNGILYRLTGPNKAFVLYDANLPEIRSILPTGNGTVYVAALGGSTAKRTGNVYGTGGSQSGTVVSAPATTITVTDSGASAQSGPELKAPKADQAKAAVQQPAAAVVQTVSVPDMAGVEKSAIYRIRPDNTVETLWSSKDENIYDIASLENRLMFSTDLQGRIYRLAADRKATLLAQTGEGEAMRLLDSAGGLMAVTGDMGKLYRLLNGTAATGFYEAPVHDSNTVARWGRLSWHADPQSGSQVVFRARSGNSARPDNTWSDWSEPMTDAAGSLIKSPNARYLQWRAEFSSTNGATPIIDSVSAAYLPQNTPPAVRSINVTTQAKPATATTAQSAASTSPNTAFSITVTDTGETASTSSGTPTQTLLRGPQQQTQIQWQADDPDGDRLVYALYFRGEDEKEWKLLRANLFENTFTLDSDILADGRYYFRVSASDRPSNPTEYARESELVSAPVLIDDTPPVVRISRPVHGSNGFDIQVDATDQTSPLRKCEYSVDATAWIPVEAVDGVTDSPTEQFHIHLENVRPGEHLLVVRVYDSAGNGGLAKTVLQ
jgi:hypothetical protein